MKKPALTAATAVLLATALTGSISAAPADASTADVRSVAASPKQSSEITDFDVVALFAGQGRILVENPDLAQYVPHNDVELTNEQLGALVDEYRAADPAFHRNVTSLLLSGDPYQVLDALNSFRDSTALIASAPEVVNVGDGRCALLVAVAVATALWLGVFLWVAVDGPDGRTNEAFAADIAASVRG